MLPVFVYGTLCDPEILSLVIGADATAGARQGDLSGYSAMVQKNAPYPALIEDQTGHAPGVVLSDLDEKSHQRLCYFENEFGYQLTPVSVEVDGNLVSAEVFLPLKMPDVTQDEWSLEKWARTDKPLFTEMAREVMSLFGQLRPGELGKVMPGIFRRALARLRAKNSTVTGDMRSVFPIDAMRLEKAENLYTGFFAMRNLEYSHTRFDGKDSGTVQREVFVTGDAVTVLAWDPRTDNVLLIEQIRAGAIARGDPNPWCLELVAGICDANESTKDTARREALEEAGLKLGALEKIAEYYSSVGGATEYTTAYIGQADLSDAGGLFGLASEQEDIRAIVVPFKDALAAIDTGEIRVVQLITSLLALQQKRDALKRQWGFAVASDEAAP